MTPTQAPHFAAAARRLSASPSSPSRLDHVGLVANAGYSISWTVYGRPHEEILSRLGLQDSGESDEANEAPVSGAQLPTGWYVVFLNDITIRSWRRQR
jgi:hypothetical protein